MESRKERQFDADAQPTGFDDPSLGPVAVSTSPPITSNDPENDDNRVEPSAIIRGDPMRFAVGAVFCIISLSNGMQWITFSAIVEEVRVYFNMTAIQVNYLTTTYVIAYVAAVFLSCKLYEITGLRVGILIAALTNAIGTVLKIIALYFWPNMILLYIAQVFNSITEILTIATPPLVANRWFPESERMVANTVLSSALNFGCAIGVLLPTFFVTPEKQEKHHFGNLFWFQFGLCGGIFVLAIFLVPARPRYMVSYAAARQQKKEEKRIQALRGMFQHHGTENGLHNEEEPGNIRETETETRREENYDENEEPEAPPTNVFSTVLDALRMLRSNPSFGFLMIASAAELGLIWAVATVLPQCLSPFGVSEVESGWIGFMNLFAGTIVAPFIMPFVERKRRYKTVLLSIAMILTINMSILTLCLAYGPPIHENRTYYVVVTFLFWGGVAGLCQNFMMPLMFEFVIELTFPMSESTSAPVLTWSACLTNLILTIVFGAVLGNSPSQGDALNVFVGATVVCFIGGLALLAVFPYRRRQEYELLMRERDDARLLPVQHGEGEEEEREGVRHENVKEKSK
ncbi:MFS transporter [Trypanosoma theileri]|uniref:MFS transporter n=1 Tax=Trypanosoma theileri TaxID=67003 RepID=A0A1X0PA49_9TRYP|nr:MFS transporter [Trypanosoma theileri]ORC93330.1 MFS transporter [Trypanosoma theileri]